MELKATSLGKHLAQHPYNRVRLLSAGVEVSGEKHEYLIPFNQLLSIRCKRGVVWGELEFTLHGDKVVRLHGTEWQETQRFYHYLNQSWQAWGEEMSLISAQVLQRQADRLSEFEQQDKWLNRSDVMGWRTVIHDTFSALPLPVERLEEFAACREAYLFCQGWLSSGEEQRQKRNARWSELTLKRYAEFFATTETSPFNDSQAQAIVNGEDALLVLAGAGSGKTSVLVARAGWLLLRKQAKAEQILLLAFSRQAAEEMNDRIKARLHTDEIETHTFHSLVLHIIRQGSNKSPTISKLETDTVLRHKLLTDVWQQQCSEKKSQANGWRQWLIEELAWQLDEGAFWQDRRLVKRIGSRLDRWLELMRMHGGTQARLIESAPEEMRDSFSKRVKLMAPLLKAWKNTLKGEGAVDFFGLLHQAINNLDKGRFISPWKHILVDEFQDISPQRAALLTALRKQNSQTSLFAVGDDWQAIYRFSGAEMALTTAFRHYFGEGDNCILDTTWRFNDRIGEIANGFVQNNPQQIKKPLISLVKGNKKAIALLPQAQLEALLNKLSGYATPEERILVLARYHYLQPELLTKAKTRWPGLTIDFATMHGSKGQQADYVLVTGLQSGEDGFPAPARESIIEQVLLPKTEDFPDAEERRLAYVAITRARKQVWLLFDDENPSNFVEHFRRMGVPVLRKA